MLLIKLLKKIQKFAQQAMRLILPLKKIDECRRLLWLSYTAICNDWSENFLFSARRVLRRIDEIFDSYRKLLRTTLSSDISLEMKWNEKSCIAYSSLMLNRTWNIKTLKH